MGINAIIAENIDIAIDEEGMLIPGFLEIKLRSMMLATSSQTISKRVLTV